VIPVVCKIDPAQTARGEVSARPKSESARQGRETPSGSGARGGHGGSDDSWLAAWVGRL